MLLILEHWSSARIWNILRRPFTKCLSLIAGTFSLYALILLLNDSESRAQANLWESLRLHDCLSSALSEFDWTFATECLLLFPFYQVLPLHILLKIAQICASERTAARVYSHLHKFGRSLFILAEPGRWNDVSCEKIIDVLIGPAFHEGTLRLIHQLLHNLRKVAIRSFIPFRLSCSRLKEVLISQILITAMLCRSLIAYFSTWRFSTRRVCLNNIIRADRFIIICGIWHGCFHWWRS